MLLFAADVKALNDVWLIGTNFLGTTFKTLQNLNSSQKNPVHMYQYYNVCPYYAQKPAIKNILIVLLQCIAEGLNERIRLPKYVLIIPDIDILASIKFYEYAMPIAFDLCLKYLMTHIARLFEERREDLKKWKPGAVGQETRFIWVNVINRPAIKYHPDADRQKIIACRQKFNITLNNLAAGTRYNHAICLKEFTDKKLFDPFGNLSPEGEIKFWREIDYFFKKFDRHECTLKPAIQEIKENKYAFSGRDQ